MPIRSELPDRRAGARPSLLRSLLWTAALAAAAAPSLAQPAAPPPPAQRPSAAAAAVAPEHAALAAELRERYQLLPSRDGVVLVPRQEVPGVQSIEVAGGEVIVNGEPVAETILRSWFGAEADPLLRLAALEPAAARALVAPPSGESPPAAAEEAEDAAADAEGAAEVLPEPTELPAAPEVPGPPRESLGAKFAVGESVEIRADEVASELMVVGGGAHVAGEVRRNLIVVGGSLRVEGEVGGDVMVVGGSVELGPESHVHGDLRSIGGGVRRAEGARVDGHIEQLSSAPWTWRHRSDEPWRAGSPFHAWRVQEAVWHLLWVVTLGLLVLFTLLVARRTTEGAAARVGSDFGDLLVSAMVGILGVVLFFLFVLPALGLVFLLLVLTIIGCFVVPLLAVAVPVVVVAVLLIGYSAVALRLGRALSGRLGKVPPGVYAPAIIGVVAVQVWGLAGNWLQVLGGPAGTIGAAFLLFGAVLGALVWLVGLGALLRHYFGGHRRPGEIAAATPPYGTLPPATPPATTPPVPPVHPGPAAPEPPAPPEAPSKPERTDPNPSS